VATCPRLSKSRATKLKQHRQLLMLMTILAQTFFTFVRRHLMSLMLLSVWHNCVNKLKSYYKFVIFCCG